MAIYYDESERKIHSNIEALKTRREAIKLEITCNSPAILFRELSMINYKLDIAQSHLNGNFKRQIFPAEYYTRPIN